MCLTGIFRVPSTIERLANRCVFELPPSTEVKGHLGQTVELYHLDKRSSLIIVAQLSPEFIINLVETARIRTAPRRGAPFDSESRATALRVSRRTGSGPPMPRGSSKPSQKTASSKFLRMSF